MLPNRDQMMIIPASQFNYWVEATSAILHLYSSFISYKEAASILNVSLPTLMDLADRELIPRYIIAGRAVTDRNGVLEYRKQRDAWLAARPGVQSRNRLPEPLPGDVAGVTVGGDDDCPPDE